MRYKTVISLLLVNIILVNFVFAQEAATGFKKNIFYKAMSGNDKEALSQQLIILKTAEIDHKTAYEGALQMKLAGMVSGPKKKLDLFKSGHKKLEAVLTKDSSNTEWRFLRLMIQEHAPGILGYKGDMEKDKLFIKNNYKKLPPVIQAAVADYSKTSKILKPADL